jgi:hypothetical protein
MWFRLGSWVLSQRFEEVYMWHTTLLFTRNSPAIRAQWANRCMVFGDFGLRACRWKNSLQDMELIWPSSYFIARGCFPRICWDGRDNKKLHSCLSLQKPKSSAKYMYNKRAPFFIGEILRKRLVRFEIRCKKHMNCLIFIEY